MVLHRWWRLRAGLRVRDGSGAAGRRCRRAAANAAGVGGWWRGRRRDPVGHHGRVGVAVGRRPPPRRQKEGVRDVGIRGRRSPGGLQAAFAGLAAGRRGEVLPVQRAVVLAHVPAAGLSPPAGAALLRRRRGTAGGRSLGSPKDRKCHIINTRKWSQSGCTIVCCCCRC